MEVACLQKKKKNILQQVRVKIKMRICMLYPWHHTAFIIWFLYFFMGLALSHRSVGECCDWSQMGSGECCDRSQMGSGLIPSLIPPWEEKWSSGLLWGLQGHEELAHCNGTGFHIRYGDASEQPLEKEDDAQQRSKSQLHVLTRAVLL